MSPQRACACCLVLLAAWISERSLAQSRPATPATAASPARQNILSRRYREGESIIYHMTGANQNDRYEVDARGVVKKGDAPGAWYEEIAWSQLAVNGTPIDLPAASTALRQRLSLAPDPKHPLAMPDLSRVHPWLIGTPSPT